MAKSVLVCCASPWSSPSRLPRVFKGAGLDVSVFAAPGQLIAKSRFVDVVIPAPLALDDYVDGLRAHLATHSYDWVIIADDPLLEALRRRREESWVAEILPIHGHAEWVGALASKADFTLLCQSAGLPIPESRLCRSIADAEVAAREIGLPMMLKRSTSFAGLGVARVDDVAQLPEIWRQLDGDSDVVVAQKFLDGKIGSSLALIANGKPLAWASGEKVRTWPGQFGPSTARRIANHPAIRPAFERFGAATGYHGFAAFDWIIDDHKELRILELNARPTTLVRIGAMAGTDFPAAISGVVGGETTVHPPAVEPYDDRVVPYFPEDILRAITQDGFSRDVVQSWLPMPGRYTDIPWQDPKVLSGYLQLSIVNVIQRRRMRRQAG